MITTNINLKKLSYLKKTKRRLKSIKGKTKKMTNTTQQEIKQINQKYKDYVGDILLRNITQRFIDTFDGIDSAQGLYLKDLVVKNDKST